MLLWQLQQVGDSRIWAVLHYFKAIFPSKVCHRSGFIAILNGIQLTPNSL